MRGEAAKKPISAKAPGLSGKRIIQSEYKAIKSSNCTRFTKCGPVKAKISFAAVSARKTRKFGRETAA
jgi:hypothetical protein